MLSSDLPYPLRSYIASAVIVQSVDRCIAQSTHPILVHIDYLNGEYRSHIVLQHCVVVQPDHQYAILIDRNTARALK